MNCYEGDVDGSDDGSFNYDYNDDVDKKHFNLASTNSIIINHYSVISIRNISS